jgi:DNA primase
MQIPKTTIQAIRERVDLIQLVQEHVRLGRKGGKWWGLCPFHQEKSPSFTVTPETGRYYCFGCNANGDCYSILMHLEGLGFGEAVRELGRRVGVKVESRDQTPEERARAKTRATLYDVCEAAEGWFHSNLMTSPEASGARDYLKSRGITEATVRECRLGFAPDSFQAMTSHLHNQGYSEKMMVDAAIARRSDNGRTYSAFRNRLIFPIFDRRKRAIAFGARAMSAEEEKRGKYINSSASPIYNKSATLYGLSWARADISKKNRVLLVEGYFDVLALYQAGFKEAVATCGTALTERHIQSIRSLSQRFYALFDGDRAGIEAAEKSLPKFIEAKVEALNVSLPDNMDPDDFINKQGAEAFQTLIDDARPLLELVLHETAKRCGPTPEGRQRAVKEMVPILRNLSGVLRAEMVQRSSNILRVDETELRKAIGRFTPPKRPEQQSKNDFSDGPPIDGYYGNNEEIDASGGFSPPHDPSAKWNGNKYLNRLINLALHCPAQTLSALPSCTEPEADFPKITSDDISTDSAVHWLIDQLVNEVPLNDIIDDVPTEGMKRLLAECSVRGELCKVDTAQTEASIALAELAIIRRTEEIYPIAIELESLQHTSNKKRITELIGQRSALQSENESLKEKIRRLKRGK